MVLNRGAQDVGCSKELKNQLRNQILEMEHRFRSDGIGKSKSIYMHSYPN
jgi:hypothetical protein